MCEDSNVGTWLAGLAVKFPSTLTDDNDDDTGSVAVICSVPVNLAVGELEAEALNSGVVPIS